MPGGRALAGDVIKIARKGSDFWVGRNAGWLAGGVPETGANPLNVSPIDPGHVWLFAAVFANSLTVNVGQTAFAYTPPSWARPVNTANLPAGGAVTSGTNDEGDFVYTGGALASVTWDGVEHAAASHDGSVIRFRGTGFIPRSGAGRGKAWTAVIETPLSARRSMRPRAVLAT